MVLVYQRKEYYFNYLSIFFTVLMGLDAVVLLALSVKRIRESFLFRTSPKQKAGPIKVKPTLE